MYFFLAGLVVSTFESYAALQLVWCTAIATIWFNTQACQLECFDARSRVAVTCVKDLNWSVHIILMGAAGYLLRDWRAMHMASGALCCLALPTWWLVPESVRWLAQNRRREEAAAVLRDMARVNGRAPLGREAEDDIDRILRY